MIYRFSANAGVQYGSGELGFADNSDIAEYAKEAVAGYEQRRHNQRH